MEDNKVEMLSLTDNNVHILQDLSELGNVQYLGNDGIWRYDFE